MSLTDLMSSFDLSIYPQVAMVLFMTVFVAVVVRTYSRSRRDDLQRAAMLPLEDESTHARPMPSNDGKGDRP